MSSECKREEKAELKPTRGSLQGRRRSIQVPFFYGRIDSYAYIEWEKEMEFLFGLEYYTEKKKLCLAVTGLSGSAFPWWQRLAQTRRFDRIPQLTSWVEMKALMRKRFAPQWELPETKPEAETKFIASDQFCSLSGPPSKPARRRPVVPAELSLKRREEKLQHSKVVSAIKQTEESHESEPELASLCLKQEEEAQVAQAECDHVLDQRKQEEKVLGESSTTPELAHGLIDQAESLKTLSCELLIQPMVSLQLSLRKHLRVAKGLQKLVFERGGSFYVHRSINNTLIQIAAVVKLDSEGFLHEQEEPMLVSSESKLRTSAEEANINVCVLYQWREAQSEAIRSKLNKEKKLLALSVACNDHSAVEHLGRVKALEGFVFEPGGELNVHNSFKNTMVQRETEKLRLDSLFIHEELDLRTNPFKGGGDGAILNSLNLNGLKPLYGSAIPLIMVQLNGQFQVLIGMIYEVLDREKI